MINGPTATSAFFRTAWWVNAIAVACAVVAVYLIFTGLYAASERHCLYLGIAAAIMAWGLWMRRPWGRILAVAACWLAIIGPIAVGALVFAFRWSGRAGDSIGHGVVLLFCGITFLAATPCALILLWAFSRPAARSLFGADKGRQFGLRDIFVLVLVGALIVMAAVTLI